ncbi:uncharacterized protein LOC125372118 [Haliotis rufescens]|uniref:uncharacterized protein LOC125372118 n=1 Tax=Haliotis rufescens TaxID=6454 RepID=UPI00201F78B4|nr:uncharacterized protein LOC125372118 [Haliotis rufescens]
MSHNKSPGSFKANKRRHVDSVSSDDDVSPIVADSWPRFIVIASADDTPLKLNPFAISKGIQSACGEVKNVTRLRSGSILVECARRQQSINLLGLKQFVNIRVAVSVHNTLNSSRGIIRDRSRCLSEMSEEEIVTELEHQGVTAVKRFTRKSEDGKIINTQTYLFTFSMSTVPKSIKAGYFNIGVEVYVPNPLWCFKCQHFGHGAKSCTAKTRCLRCGGPHDGTDCTNVLKCANCSGEHLSSSKSCPIFVRESQILKLKHTNNISYSDAKKLLLPSQTPSSISYSAAVSSATVTSLSSGSKMTKSIHCQTAISWINDDQIIIDEAKPSKPTTLSSSSQTENLQTLTSQQIEPDITEEIETVQGEAHLSKKQTKKQMRRKARALQHLEEPSPVACPVVVHNPFEPLDMEVTPTLPGHGNVPSTRLRTPVEPP